MLVKIFFILLAIFFSFQIIHLQGYKKLIWFAIGILFFPNSIILLDSPILINFPRLITYVIIINTVLFRPNWWHDFRHFPLKKSLSILLLTLLLIGLFDRRLTPVLKIYRPITVFCENFFLLFISYYYVRKVGDVLRLYKAILFSFLLFALFGILNYLQHKNIYYLLLTKTYGAYDFASVNMAAFVERFRISSFAWHAIYYGLLLTFATLLSIFIIRSSNAKKKLNYYFLIILLLINLFLVNSRTPLFALIAGFLIFFLWGFGIVTKFRIIIILIVIAVPMLVFSPKVQQLLLASVETVSSNKPNFEEGSSVEMRLGQLRASIALFKQNPVTGNGIYYINESLGYSPDYKDRQSDKSLYGFESYIYLLLIEQGILGIASNIFLIISLFIFFIKNYNVNDPTSKRISLLSLSLLISFLLFIIATGDMGSFTFFMLLIGANIKAITLRTKFKMSRAKVRDMPIPKS